MFVILCKFLLCCFDSFFSHALMCCMHCSAFWRFRHRLLFTLYIPYIFHLSYTSTNCTLSLVFCIFLLLYLMVLAVFFIAHKLNLKKKNKKKNGFCAIFCMKIKRKKSLFKLAKRYQMWYVFATPNQIRHSNWWK